MVTGEEDDLLAGTTTVRCDAQRQAWSAEPNRAARAGQSRPGSGDQVAQDAMQARRWDAWNASGVFGCWSAATGRAARTF